MAVKKTVALILLITIVSLFSFTLMALAQGSETAGAQLIHDEDGNLTHVETGNGKLNANENSTAGNNPIEVAGS